MSISTEGKLDLFMFFIGITFVSLSVQFPLDDKRYPENIPSNKIRDLTLKSNGVEAMRKFNKDNNNSAKNLKINWSNFSNESKSRCLRDLYEIEYQSYIYLEKCLTSHN